LGRRIAVEILAKMDMASMRVWCVAGFVLWVCTEAYGQTSTLQNLTINQAVEEAIRNNPQLIAQRRNVSIAETEMITARQRPNPVLTLGGDHVDLNGPLFAPDIGVAHEYSIRTDFVFERGGKRQHRIDIAEQAQSVARVRVLEAVRALILDIENVAIDILEAKANLELARGNLQAIDEIIGLNERRVQLGDLAEVELIRSRVAALQVRNQVFQSESQLRIARNRLQHLLGRSATDPVADITDEIRKEPLLLNLGALEERALKLRPDLAGLHQEQARFLYELRLQLATGKVDYTIGVEYRRIRAAGSGFNSIGLFFSMPLPVFDRNRGQIERVRRQQLEIEDRVRAVESQIRSELRAAFEQYETSRALLAAIEGDMLDRARRVREINEYTYRRGESSLLDFLDAQRTFNETMQGYYDARAEYARSLYLIESITGKVAP
jgi:cobalt-zinc-cadmium efflux system outer membrane protein